MPPYWAHTVLKLCFPPKTLAYNADGVFTLVERLSIPAVVVVVVADFKWNEAYVLSKVSNQIDINIIIILSTLSVNPR